MGEGGYGPGGASNVVKVESSGEDPRAQLEALSLIFLTLGSIKQSNTGEPRPTFNDDSVEVDHRNPPLRRFPVRVVPK